jgi:hypothetical protein
MSHLIFYEISVISESLVVVIIFMNIIYDYEIITYINNYALRIKKIINDQGWYILTLDINYLISHDRKINIKEERIIIYLYLIGWS